MTRFTRLPPDVQKLVAGCVIALVVAAGGALSWTLHARAAAAQSRLDTSSANRSAMTALVERFESRRGSGAATDLGALVTRSLQGKSFQPSQIQQQNGELALRLDNAPFNEVLAWMLELEKAGAVPGNVAMVQARPAGVTVTLVLRGG